MLTVLTSRMLPAASKQLQASLYALMQGGSERSSAPTHATGHSSASGLVTPAPLLWPPATGGSGSVQAGSNAGTDGSGSTGLLSPDLRALLASPRGSPWQEPGPAGGASQGVNGGTSRAGLVQPQPESLGGEQACWEPLGLGHSCRSSCHRPFLPSCGSAPHGALPALCCRAHAVEPPLMLASPSARLPTSVSSLLASPDFRCTFAPPGSGSGGAAAAAAAAASLGSLGVPLFGMPLHLAGLEAGLAPVGQLGSSALPGQAPPLTSAPPAWAHQPMQAPPPPQERQHSHPPVPSSGQALPGQPLLSQPLPLPRFGWVAVQPQGAAPAVPGEHDRRFGSLVPPLPLA